MFQFLLDIDMEKVDFDDDETLLKMKIFSYCTLSISLYLNLYKNQLKVLSKVSASCFSNKL